MADWTYAARDGAILAAGACALIAGIVLWRPRLLLRHYPEALRAVQPPKSRGERAASLAAGLVLLGWIFGMLTASALAAERRLGEGFWPLFVHAWSVGMAFNLADWLLLDELWLGRFPPPALAAAAGGAPVPFERGKHFADFLKGAFGMALIAAAVAGGLALF